MAHENSRDFVLIYQLPDRLVGVRQRHHQHVRLAGDIFETVDDHGLNAVLVRNLQRRFAGIDVIGQQAVIVIDSFIQQAAIHEYLVVGP